MKTFKQFLLEHASGYSLVQRCVINAWGRLLYLDYLKIPMGERSWSTHQELLWNYAQYEKMDEDERADEDEWYGSGCKLNDGTHLLNRKTIDEVLHSCEAPAPADMVLYRYGEHPGKLTPDSWLSLTSDPKEAAYPGERHEIHVPKGTPVVDTKGLADKDEWIMWTTTLLEIMKK